MDTGHQGAQTQLLINVQQKGGSDTAQTLMNLSLSVGNGDVERIINGLRCSIEQLASHSTRDQGEARWAGLP